MDVGRGLVAGVNLTERGVEHLGRLVKIRVGLCLGNLHIALPGLAASLLIIRDDLATTLLVLASSLLVLATSLPTCASVVVATGKSMNGRGHLVCRFGPVSLVVVVGLVDQQRMGRLQLGHCRGIVLVLVLFIRRSRVGLVLVTQW